MDPWLPGNQKSLIWEDLEGFFLVAWQICSQLEVFPTPARSRDSGGFLFGTLGVGPICWTSLPREGMKMTYKTWSETGRGGSAWAETW